jgi:hypothetical protein
MKQAHRPVFSPAIAQSTSHAQTEHSVFSFIWLVSYTFDRLEVLLYPTKGQIGIFLACVFRNTEKHHGTLQAESNKT